MSRSGARGEDGSLRKRAYDYIQQKILTGQFLAGMALSEIALAREIGISRTPVREAIGRLASEGLLEQIPGRGAVVVNPGREDIVELYELREALEVYAVGKAARRQPPASDLAMLHALCEEVLAIAGELRSSGCERLDEAQMHRFVCADMKFHMLLLRAAGNRRIMRVVGETRVLTRIFSYRREGHDARLLERIYQYHHDILQAVESGNAQEAMERMGQHIRVSMQERLDTYDRWEREREFNRIMPLPPLLAQLGGLQPDGAELRPDDPHDQGPE